MNTPTKNGPDLEEELSLLVDGDAAALDRHGDALADSAETQDLVHDARRISSALEELGADYVPPADLEGRILSALDERPVEASGEAGRAERSSETNTPEGARRGGGIASTPRRGKIGAFILGIAAAMALAFGLDGSSPDAPELSAHPDAWSARVMESYRAGAPGGPSGLEIRAPGEEDFAPAAAGDALLAGAALRTDARTRLRLELSEGTTLILNQSTEVEIAADAARGLRLLRGELVADVEHLAAGPLAEFELPTGRVEVLGTKFALTAADSLGSVRVTRGAVRVHGEGASVRVEAGQEGLMAKGEAPRSVPAVHVADSIRWSELDGDLGDEIPVTGIGELRARRPGEREDREQPLTLSSHKVRVRIVGNVARTEIEESFQNDGDHELEGIYSFPLPPEARIAGLSLKVEGEWEAGAFVPKDRAARIWRGVIRNATPERERVNEEFIWIPGPWRDPALLEWQQGGRFELRIFPIPAHGAREVRLSYEETLTPVAGGHRYVYPLAHAADDSTRVGSFDVDVRVADADGSTEVGSRGYALEARREEDAWRLHYAATDFDPHGDLIIDTSSPGAARELTYWSYEGAATVAPAERSREGAPEIVREQRALHEDARGYVVFALRPDLPAWSEHRPRDYVLVVDSSQSMVGQHHERALRVAGGIVAEMDRRDRFSVLACDLNCRRFADELRAPSGEAAREVAAFLRGVEPAGSSNLARSLRAAAEFARARGGEDREAHLIYIGDGMSTAGPRRPASLAAETADLVEGRSLRISTAGVGNDSDTLALGAIARAGHGHFIPAVTGQPAATAALAILEGSYGVSLEKPELIFPEGVSAVAPSALPTLRAGEEVLIVGRVDGHVRGEAELRGTVGGERWSRTFDVDIEPTAHAGNAFVPRLWASQTIEELELERDGVDVPKVVALSKAFGVMSRHTSLLVLESEAMFRAFGVDRATPTLQWSGEEAAQLQATGYVGAEDDLDEAGGLGASAFGPSARRSRSGAGGMPAPMSAPMASADSSSSFAGAPQPSVTREEARPSEQARRRPTPPGRGGRWMRRVWYSEGQIRSGGDVRERDHAAARTAEARLSESPDSRDRHRDLVRALSRAGRIEEGLRVTEAWIERDRLDPEALTYRSDLLGRLGRRDEALRVLSGVVDLAPEDAVQQRRLARAFERGDRSADACAHWVSLAELPSAPVAEMARAVRCERAEGRQASAERIQSAMEDPARRRALTQALERHAAPTRLRGQLLLDASWTGSSDVDLSIITPQGTRLSWMGGRIHVVGQDGGRVGRERLGLRRVTRGSYYVEVNRVDPKDLRPVRGEVRVRLLGRTSTFRFDLEGERQTVGRVDVVRRSRMEPSSGPQPRR